MSLNSKFSIQLLEKIGAPLAAAIESATALDNKPEDSDVEAAKIMAQLLGQAVQISITLNSSLGLSESEEQADSTRLALAAIAAPMLGNFYKENKRVPADQDIQRIIKSLEAVLAFSDNFTPLAISQSRLTTIDHDAPLLDETQPSLIVMQTLTPVMNAIAEFPFGQSETKLIQDVAVRLRQHAAEINGDDKLGELMVFKSLANIYAECHRAETARLSQSNDEERGELSLDPVWEDFATRLEMVKVLAGIQTSPAVSSTSSAVAPQQAVGNAAPPAPPPLESPSVAPPQPAEAVPQAAAPAASSSPMGFFKPGAKTADTGAPAAPPAEAAPVASTPAAPVAPTEQTTTFTQTPATPPPASDGNAPAAASGSPMGFFAKKKPEEGES